MRIAASCLAVLLVGCTSASGPGSDRAAVGNDEAPGLVPHEISVSALARGGAVRCTATFPSSLIAPGAPTGVKFTVENISDPNFSISEGAGNGQIAHLVERSRAGALIQDTSHMHDGVIGGAPLSHPIGIGSSISLPAYDPPVIYASPILITPVCPLTPGSLMLPRVMLGCSCAGQAPAAVDAVRRAVAAAGAAFSQCTPTQDRVWVMGISHTDAGTPFNARCGAVVLHAEAFDDVILGIVSPAHAPAIDVVALASQLGIRTVDVRSAVAVSVWRFVITTDTLREVAQFSVAQGCEGNGYEGSAGALSCRFPTR